MFVTLLRFILLQEVLAAVKEDLQALREGRAVESNRSRFLASGCAGLLRCMHIALRDKRSVCNPSWGPVRAHIFPFPTDVYTIACVQVCWC